MMLAEEGGGPVETLWRGSRGLDPLDTFLSIAQLTKFIFVEPVMMGQFVKDRDTNFSTEPIGSDTTEGVRRGGQNAFAIDGHYVGQPGLFYMPF